MPIYGISNLAPFVLTPGAGIKLWDNEIVALAPSNLSVSQAGIMRRDQLGPYCLSIEVEFAANPGAFGIELQTADTDQDKYYVTKALFDKGLNVYFVGRIEAVNVVAKFVRLKMVSLTNAVRVTAKVY